MKLEELIQMRRKKEADLESSAAVKIPLDLYPQEVERALSFLSHLERWVIGLRFIDPHPIARIADQVGLSWDSTDQLIDESLKKIHKFFKENEISRLKGTA